MNITIAYRNSTMTVDAQPIARHFALHPDVDGGGWTVTHTPSGYAVHFGATFPQAVRVARRLARLPLDWSGANVAPFEAYARAHPWRMAWALETMPRHWRGRWVRFVKRASDAIGPLDRKVRAAVIDQLDKRADVCWSEAVGWAATGGWREVIDLVPAGRWYSGVGGCRRDARLHGTCYCGKFCTETAAREMGCEPGAARPIIVTSEYTDLDRGGAYITLARPNDDA